jgi:putative endonuclease
MYTFVVPYFYIARCADDSLYSGACKDLEERENKHNSGKGAKYTRARLPIKIVYSEEFPTLSEALKREAQVKKLKRVDKEKLLDGEHSN